MSWIRGLSQRLRVVLRFSRVESDLEHELRDHLNREVQRQLRMGLSPEEARRHAALRVGGIEALKEETRDERGGRLVTDAIGDLRIGWRGLRRNPGFTIAVILSLSLGAAGTTAIFSVVHAVVLRPLPYPDAERLHLVRVAWNDFSASLSAADFLRLREARGGVADVGAFWFPSNGFTMLSATGPEVVQGAGVTPDLPRVLGVPPSLGRLLSDDPDAREALISTELWRQRFDAARDALGRPITLDGNAYTIVGVMPAGYNVPGQPDGAVWIGAPLKEPTRRGPFWLSVLARLGPDLTSDAASAKLTGVVTPILRDRYRVDPDWRYLVLPMKDVLVGDVRPTLLLLFATVGLVLLIAVVNVASLLLARGTARTRELAVRASLGAGRGRLARQLLTESALLGLLGGVLGVGMAAVLLQGVGILAKTIVPRVEEVRFDLVALAFGLAVGILAGLLAGIVPVFWLTWSRLGDALRDGGRNASEGARRGRARRVLVAGEVALTLTVLIGATLLAKSLIRLQTVDPGFRVEGVLSFRLSLPSEPYQDVQRLEALLSTLDTRLRGLPGVSSVAFAASLPPDLLQESNNYTIEGHERGTPGANTQGSGVAPWISVSPDYFSTLGIPLTRGRGFAESDRAGAPPVAIVSEAFVQRHFPDRQVLGKRFKGGDWDPQEPWTTIVGVVGDVPYARGIWGGISPTIYLSHAQNLGNRSPYVVLKAGDPSSLVSAVGQAVLSVDPRVPLRNVASMQERLHASTAAPRFRTVLFSLLAGVALVVAITGIYGVLAYHVNQRRRETAIRRALGAPAAYVVGAVVGAGLRLTLVGLLVGLAGGLVLARSLAGVLYDVRPNDPIVFATAAGVLLAAALAACIVPALRAIRIDPVSVLRAE